MAKARWKTKRNRVYLCSALAIPRFYVRVPHHESILSMEAEDLEATVWLMIDYHCLALPIQNQLRKLPETQVFLVQITT